MKMIKQSEQCSETEFLSGLIKLNCGMKVKNKLKKAASEISWLNNWPEDDESFWNAEAFMWNYKIDREKRELISREINQEFKPFSNSNKFCKNLDLGCGSYSYVKSVGFDISEKMLSFNENLTEKVVGSLENKLPFKNNLFDTATAIFVLNYVKNYSPMLFEIARVIKPKGKFIAVLSSTKINQWQRQKEINYFSAKKWVLILKKVGFKVIFKQKSDLMFFKCRLI